MNTFEKLTLSGSSNGAPIQVTGTAAGSSVIVHTATSQVDETDEVWLYANSIGTGNAVTLTIYVGTDSAANRIQVGVPSKQGLIYVIPGLVYKGGLVLRAYAGSANEINLHGWVNRITLTP